MKKIKYWLNKEKSNKILFIGLIIFSLVLLFILFLPYIILNLSFGYDLGVSESNEIGDSIGGILGPVVGLLAALLTFLAFWAQMKANEQVQNQFKIQEFNNKLSFYHNLLKNTRIKIEEYYCIDINSNKTFSFYGIFKEFNIIYNVISVIDYFFFHISEKNLIPDVNDDNTIRFDDYSIYFNVIKDENRILTRLKLAWVLTYRGYKKISYFKNEHFLLDVHDELGYKIIDKKRDTLYLQDKIFNFSSRKINKKINSNDIASTIKCLNIIFLNGIDLNKYNGLYNILSPYFQLFFQITKFVDSTEFMNYNEKYSIIKIFRAEMSKDEIFIFYLNCMSGLGYDWEFNHRNQNQSILHLNINLANKCFITKYNLIKHIVNDTNINIDFNSSFSDLIFSWDSDSERKRKKEYRDRIFE